MRSIKMLGLAMIAAIAATACLGASSAVAMNTALCKTNEGGALSCAEANQYKTIHAVATDPVILNGVANLLCASSLLEAKLLGLAAPQIGHVTSLTWSECKAGSFPCTITTKTLGLLLFLKTAVNLGEMQFHEMTLLVKCSLLFECLYEGLPTFHLLGAEGFGDEANNGGFRGKETPLASPLDACPPEIFLDIFWGALEPVYIKT